MAFTFVLLATLISCLTLHTNAAAISARKVEKYNSPVERRAIDTRSPDLHILRPISIDPLYYALNRRDEVRHLTDYTRLDPSDEELMIFGTPVDDGSFFVANLTLRAPPKTQILLMEKFEGLTRRVDCSTIGDNKLSVSFIDWDVFEYSQVWNWLNKNDDNEFVMITNHDGCGPAAQRAVFWVRRVDYVEEDLRVDFYAVSAEWKEVTGTYAVDFGMMYPERKYEPGYLEKREPINIGGVFRGAMDGAKKGLEKAGGAIKGVANDAAKALEKTVNDAKAKLGPAFDKVAQVVSKAGDGKVGQDNISLNLAAGTPGKKTNIYTDILQPKNPRQIIDCLDCYVKGKIMMSGHLQFENFLPKAAIIEAKPQDLATVMKFGVLLKANKDKKGDGQTDALRFEIPIFKIPLPGLSIPFVFELGPKAQLTIGFVSNIKSDAEFRFGLQGSAPNTAVFRKDLFNKDAPATSNSWEGAKVESLPFELVGGSIEMNFEVSTNLVLGVGMKATGLFNYEAGFKLRLPRYAANLTTITNQNGQPACNGNANKSPTGVFVKNDVNIELVAVAGNTMVIGQFKEAKLLAFKIPLPDKCHPIKDLRPTTTKPAVTNPVTTTPTVGPTLTITSTGKPVPLGPVITPPALVGPPPPVPVAPEPVLTGPALVGPPLPEPVPTEPVLTEPVPTEPALTRPVAVSPEIGLTTRHDALEPVVEIPVGNQALYPNIGQTYPLGEQQDYITVPDSNIVQLYPKRRKYRMLRG